MRVRRFFIHPAMVESSAERTGAGVGVVIERAGAGGGEDVDVRGAATGSAEGAGAGAAGVNQGLFSCVGVRDMLSRSKAIAAALPAQPLVRAGPCVVCCDAVLPRRRCVDFIGTFSCSGGSDDCICTEGRRCEVRELLRTTGSAGGSVAGW